MIDILQSLYPWIKALHIMAVIAWMAGLFYLPRLFVYHAERATVGSELDQTFQIMEEKLLRVIMNPAMIVAWIAGLIMIGMGAFDWGAVWSWVKLISVIMMTGVNGAGKTTSIGKLTRHLSDAGASVLLAAGDTFRAAAREQLDVWAGRNQVDIVSQDGGDPAAVSYDAVKAGIARRKDVVLIDTAGRLPTQTHLMDELKKIKRVIQKAEGSAPHEVLLVIDGNTGQNALAQVKAFDDALGLTGLIVTKLDGTAKGGVLAAIAMERPIPVYFIGVGETMHDLRDFNASEFAHAIFG